MITDLLFLNIHISLSFVFTLKFRLKFSLEDGGQSRYLIDGFLGSIGTLLMYLDVLINISII